MRRGRPAAKLSPTQATLIIVFMIAFSGCKTDVDIPDVVREPEIAGEIALREFEEGDTAVLHTVEGDQVQIDLNRTARIGGSTDADEGDLFLYGTQPDGPWFWSGPLLDDPVTGRQCAYLGGPALEQGDSITFAIGLRLPKAADFDPAEVRNGEYLSSRRVFCVDENGEVTRYGV